MSGIVVTSCPRCGAWVSMSERDIAEGASALCDDCESKLPGMYELVMAERRNLDADPDWQERMYNTPCDVTVDTRSGDTIVITDLDRELWRFTAEDIDLVLLELESLLLAIRQGYKPNAEHIERAFDHIKLLRSRITPSA